MERRFYMLGPVGFVLMQAHMVLNIPAKGHYPADLQVAVMCQDMHQWTSKGREEEDC